MRSLFETSHAQTFRPAAAVCAGANIADRMVTFLQTRDLGVPDDASLIGFGIPQHVMPNGIGLTTVTQSGGRIGRSAAKLILLRSENPGTRATHVRVSHNLTERGRVKRLDSRRVLGFSSSGETIMKRGLMAATLQE